MVARAVGQGGIRPGGHHRRDLLSRCARSIREQRGLLREGPVPRHRRRERDLVRVGVRREGEGRRDERSSPWRAEDDCRRVDRLVVLRDLLGANAAVRRQRILSTTWPYALGWLRRDGLAGA